LLRLSHCAPAFDRLTPSLWRHAVLGTGLGAQHATCSHASSCSGRTRRAFLDDLAIPFYNNQAERDLRKRKVQQKVADCVRAPSGSTAFARLRSSLAALRT
jgi:hypothetical protein